MQMFTIWIYRGISHLITTYRELIVEIADAEHVNPEALVGAEWVDTELLAHLEELITKDGIRADLFLVLHGERLQVAFELSDLLGHLCELRLLYLAAHVLQLLLDSLVLFQSGDSDSASHFRLYTG